MINNYKKVAISSIVFFLILMLVLFPSKYMGSIQNGFSLFLFKVAPASFPFFFLSKLLIELNKNKTKSNIFQKLFCKIYNTSPLSFNIFILSILSGYPLNAKFILDYYENNLISKSEAKKIFAFTSTSGPLFIIGSVGTLFLKNTKISYVFYIGHIISALLNGLIFRNIKIDKIKSKTLVSSTHSNILLDTMLDSFKSLFIVCGYITIFYMVIDILQDIKIIYFLEKFFNIFLDEQLSNIIATSIFELTKGMSLITSYNKCTLALIAGCISFAGLSIDIQSYAFLRKIGISFSYLLLVKLCQSIITILVTYLLLLI